MAPSHPPCWLLLPQQIFLPKHINILALLTYSAGGGRGKRQSAVHLPVSLLPYSYMERVAQK